LDDERIWIPESKSEHVSTFGQWQLRGIITKRTHRVNKQFPVLVPHGSDALGIFQQLLLITNNYVSCGLTNDHILQINRTGEYDVVVAVTQDEQLVGNPYKAAALERFFFALQVGDGGAHGDVMLSYYWRFNHTELDFSYSAELAEEFLCTGSTGEYHDQGYQR
jgi:hypothetical protein